MKLIQVLNSYEIFLARLNIALERFPSSQKFTFRTRIHNKAISIWEDLLRTEVISNRSFKLQNSKMILEELEILQGYIRLSKDQGFLGYIDVKDMKFITQERDQKTWMRKLTNIELQRKSIVWKKNAETEFFKLSKMLSEVVEKLLTWRNELKSKRCNTDYVNNSDI